MIYFIQFKSGAIKIGFTDNLNTRIMTLRSQYRGAELLHTTEGDYETEKSLHERFEHLRLYPTEQFQPGPDLLAFIGLSHLVTPNPETIEVQPKNESRRVVFHISLSPRIMEGLNRLCARPITPIEKSAFIEHLIARELEQDARRKEKQA